MNQQLHYFLKKKTIMRERSLHKEMEIIVRRSQHILILLFLTFIAFPNAGNDENIVYGEKRDKGPSNHNVEGKDNESQREDDLEERGNIDTASSSFSQEDMIQNIVVEFRLLHSQKTQTFEDTFITKMAAKLSTELR